MGCEGTNQIDLVEDSGKQGSIVNMAVNLRVPQISRNSQSIQGTVTFARMTLLYGVSFFPCLNLSFFLQRGRSDKLCKQSHDIQTDGDWNVNATQFDTYEAMFRWNLLPLSLRMFIWTLYMSQLLTEMSAPRTSSLGPSSRSGDNNHGNIGNATVRIITAVTITTLMILLTEMVLFSPPQFRNVLVFSRHFIWRRRPSVIYYQRLNLLPDFHDIRYGRSSQKCVNQA